MKIALKIVLIIAIYVLASSLIILFFLIPSFENRHTNTLIDEYKKSLLHNEDYISRYIEDISADINMISHVEQIYVEDNYKFTSYLNAENEDFLYNPSERELFIANKLDKYKELNEDLEDLFIGFEDGSFICSLPIDLIGDGKDFIYNYDPRVRPWYVNAMDNYGETIVSPLYQRMGPVENYDTTSYLSYYVTVAKAIQNSREEKYGVIGVNINLLDLLHHLDVSIHGKIDTLGIIFDNENIFLFNEASSIIIPSDEQHELRQSIYSSNYDSEDNENIIIREKIEKINAELFYIIDKEMIREQIKSSLDDFILAIILSTSFLVILIVSTLTFFIIMPIRKLNSTTTIIRETMNLDKQVDYKSADELGNLAKNFNYMVKEFKLNKDNIESIVENRTLELTKFSKAINQSPVSVVITDLDGNIEYVNPMFTKITGYTKDEAMGQNPRILKSGAHKLCFYEKLWDTIISGEDWNGVLVNKKKNGDIFYEKTIISAIKGANDEIVNFLAIKEDITEKKMTEEKLKHALDDKELILESVEEGIIGVEADGTISFTNRKAKELLCYKEQELAGKSLQYIVSSCEGDTHCQHGCAMINAIVNQQSYKMENGSLLRKDGVEIKVELDSVPVIRDQNHFSAVVVFRDITESTKIRKELEALFDNMPTGFADHEMIYDESGKAVDYRFTKINESFKKQTGLNTEIVGRTVYELMPKTEQTWIDQYEEVLTTRKPITVEEYSQELDQYYRVVAFSTGEKTFATLFDNITETKQANQLIKDSEKRLSFLFETTPFAVVTTVKGIIYYANQNFINLTGLNLKDSAINAYSDPEDRLQIVDKIKRGEEIVNLETKFINAEGQVVPVLLSVTKTNIEGEEGLLGWIMDISDIKKFEEQLIVAKEQAEAATIAKSNFLANMSHEIRTPMNAVMGFNKLMQNTKLSNRQADYVDKIERSADQLLRIITDILDFSKIESGKMNIEHIDFNLEDVIKDQISISAYSANKKKVELIVDKDSDVPDNLKGDPYKLGQILRNLLSNAVKFTEDGQIEVIVRLIERIDNRATIRFVVADSGIGISKEQIDKLFKPFTQADNSTTRKYGGTGLGLVISKEFVEMMDGQMSVSSQENKGSKFEFTITADVVKENAVKKKSAENMRILVIDGNSTTRNVVGKYIREFGFLSKLVSSFADAKEELDSNDYKLVLVNCCNEDDHKFMNKHLIDYKSKIVLMQCDNDEKIIEGENSDLKVLYKPIFQSSLYNMIAECLYSDDDTYFVKRKRDYKKISSNLSSNHFNILIVEDNEINRIVLKDILENAGFTVFEAENGKIAVEKVKKSSYDLVLMDIQMPVVDGYDATKEIRKCFSKEELPIIALTADALIETKAKVLQIGMNDFLSKPIDILNLYEKLSLYFNIDDLGYYSSESKKIVDILKAYLTDFDVNSAVKRVGNKIDFYLKILNKFEADNINLIKNIRNDVNRINLSGLKKTLHSLKGVSAYIGAETLKSQVMQMELLVEKGKIDDNFDNNIIKLNEMLENIFIQIKTVTNELIQRGVVISANDKENSNNEIINDLENIVRYIRINDEAPMKLIEQVNRKIGNKNISGMLTLVKEYIENNQLEKAVILIENTVNVLGDI